MSSRRALRVLEHHNDLITMRRGAAKRLKVAEAEDLLSEWLLRAGWLPDRMARRHVMLGEGSNGVPVRVVFLRAAIRIEEGGRGHWEKRYRRRADRGGHFVWDPEVVLTGPSSSAFAHDMWDVLGTRQAAEALVVAARRQVS